MSTHLRDGSSSTDPRLGRLVHFDERSRRHGIMQAVEQAWPRSYTWECLPVLNQGKQGACAEFAFVHELLARPASVPVNIGAKITAKHLIYWPAQRNDPWAGGSYPGASPLYEGTSVLAAVQQVQALGFLSGYRWAFGPAEALIAISRSGPVVLGVPWYDRMFDTDRDGYVRVGGGLAGGHAILARGVRLVWQRGTAPVDKRSAGWWDHLDQDRSYVLLRNSWGLHWGRGGDGLLTVADLGRLLAEQGEVCVPVGRRLTASAPLD